VATYRYIYWRNDLTPNEENERFANVHLLLGYGNRITDYKDMADELRKTFPQATDDQISGSKITKSSFVNGFTIVMWNAHIPEGEYLGWRQVEYRNEDNQLVGVRQYSIA
jgi:hypothetical protein